MAFLKDIRSVDPLAWLKKDPSVGSSTELHGI